MVAGDEQLAMMDDDTVYTNSDGNEVEDVWTTCKVKIQMTMTTAVTVFAGLRRLEINVIPRHHHRDTTLTKILKWKENNDVWCLLGVGFGLNL
jgi:hypothetical protein